MRPQIAQDRNLMIWTCGMMKTLRSITTVSLPLLKACVLDLNLTRWLPRRKSHRGRPPFSSMSLLFALLLKIHEQIPYDTTLARKLEEIETYRCFCGFRKGNTPSHDTLSRFNRKLTPRRLQTLIRKIDAHLAELGAFWRDELSLDGTDLLSNGRNRHSLDPEAGYGHKTDGERFHGYWAIFVTGTKSEMVRAVQVSPANIHQSLTAQQLFDDLEQRDLCGTTLFTVDSVCDDKKSYRRCIELGVVPLIAYNPRKSKRKSFKELPPSNWRKRSLGKEGIRLYAKYYHQRGAVERYNSTFKEILAGRIIPVRGLIKVTKHVLLTCLLSQLYGVVNWLHQTNQTVLVQRNLTYYLN